MRPSRRMGATDKVKEEGSSIRGRGKALDHFKSLMQTSTIDSFRVNASALTSSAASSDVTGTTTSVPSSSVPSTSASETGGLLRKSLGGGARDRGRAKSLAGVPGLDTQDDVLSHHSSHHHHHHHNHSKPRSSSGTSADLSVDQPKARTKSIITLGSKPIAVFMEDPSSTTGGAESSTASSLPVVSITPSNANKKNKLFKIPTVVTEPPPPSDAEIKEDDKRLSDKQKRGIRTFRIWAPNEHRKSITIRVSDKKEPEKETEEIFNATQIRHKTYGQWKKEAKAQLPSVTGGPAVQTVEELINVAPTLQKEENPRLIQSTIKKLSLDKEKEKKVEVIKLPVPKPPPPPPQPEKKKVDYTKVREITVPQPLPTKVPSPPAVEKVPEPQPVKKAPPPPPPPKPKLPAPKKVPPPVVKAPVPPPPPPVVKAPVPPPPPPVVKAPVPPPPPPVVKAPVPPPPPPVVKAPVPPPKTPPPPPPIVPVVKEEPEEQESSSSSSSSSIEIPSYFIISMEESDDEERRLERERHQAGIEIKNKIKNLRELAEHLTAKRKIRQALIESATGFTLLDTEQIPIKEQILYLIEESTDFLRDCIEKSKFWQKGINEINGRYGVVISSYFIWLRQMVAIELFAFSVVILIIIFPQAVEEINAPSPTIEYRPEFQLTNLLNGEGWLHYSFLYYSGYTNRNEDDVNPFHNPAFRFIFCMLFMFFVFTYFIFSRLTKYYQSVRMESKVSGVAHMEHFKSIICGWDYSCRDSEAKVYLHKTIYREMKFLLTTTKTGMTLVHLDMEQKPLLKIAVNKFGFFWGPWAIHILANVLLLVACVILGFLLVYLCDLKFFYYVTCVPNRDDLVNRQLDHPILCPDGDPYLSTWILSLPALFASMTTLLLTHLILLIGDYETWNTPQRKIYAAMIRSGLFYFTNILVFYLFWISKKPSLRDEGFVPETIFGKELYRLVVIQGIMDVVLNFGVKIAYHIIQKKRLKEKYKMTEFRIEYCSLSMFFIHSVSRIGTLFCPPLSIFVTLRLVLDYYQNRYALLHMSSQESYNAHASLVYAPFLLTFFILCYLITSFMNVYYIADTVPSTYNGPFVRYNQSYDEVLGLLLKSEEGTNWIRHFANPAFILVFNAILAGSVYFFYQLARTYEPLMEHLNELINLERADRDILLKAIFEVGQIDDTTKGPKKNQTSTALQVMSSLEVTEDESSVGPAGDKKKPGGGGSGTSTSRKIAAKEVDKKITEVMAKFHGTKVTDPNKRLTAQFIRPLPPSQPSQKQKKAPPPPRKKPVEKITSLVPPATPSTPDAAPAGKPVDQSHPITELVHVPPPEPKAKRTSSGPGAGAAQQSKIDLHKQALSELSVTSGRRNSVWKSWGSPGGSALSITSYTPSLPVSATTSVSSLKSGGGSTLSLGTRAGASSKPVVQQNVFPASQQQQQPINRPTAVLPGIHKTGIAPAGQQGKPLTAAEANRLRYSMIIRGKNQPVGHPKPDNVDDHINNVIDGIKHRRPETGNTLQGEAPTRKSIFGGIGMSPKRKSDPQEIKKKTIKFAGDQKNDKLNSIMGNILNKRSQVMKGMRHEVPLHKTTSSQSASSAMSVGKSALKQKGTTTAPQPLSKLNKLNAVKGGQQKTSPGKGLFSKK